jgi:hypothetical protein
MSLFNRILARIRVARIRAKETEIALAREQYDDYITGQVQKLNRMRAALDRRSSEQVRRDVERAAKVL